jgi:hypothetical protein
VRNYLKANSDGPLELELDLKEQLRSNANNSDLYFPPIAVNNENVEHEQIIRRGTFINGLQ